MPPTTTAPRSTQGGTIGAAQTSIGASGSASSHIYNALAAGSMSGAGGARRPAPEMVVPFTLPSAEQVEAWSQKQTQQKGRKRQRRMLSQEREEESDQEGSESELTEGGTLLSIEQR